MTSLGVRKVGEGLWTWDLPDPYEAGALVTSVYVELAGHVALIDPVLPTAGSPDASRFMTHLDRDLTRTGHDLAIVLTANTVDPSADCLVERGAVVFSPLDATLPDGLLADTVRPSEARIVIDPRRRAAFCGRLLGGGGTQPLVWGTDKGVEIDLAAREEVLDRLLRAELETLLVARGDGVVGAAAAALDALRVANRG
jgi:hypothetical protein